MTDPVTLLLESYGPIGMLAVVLWRRQRVMIGSILTLAQEIPDVDEERMREKLRRL